MIFTSDPVSDESVPYRVPNRHGIQSGWCLSTHGYSLPMVDSGLDWAAIGDWVLKFAGILLAPVAAILGTLLGARIANRNALHRWRAEQREARLSTARKAAIEVAESGYEWATAIFGYGRWQLAAGSEPTPPPPSLSEALSAAQTRHEIAFATFYVSVSDPATIAAARALDAERTPFQNYLGDDIEGVLSGEPAARRNTLRRLITGYGGYSDGIGRYVSAIAPLLAPVTQP